MKITPLLSLLLTVGFLIGAPMSTQAAQMTGKILAVSSTTITLQSGTEVWDIQRVASTSVSGSLKVGSTVTVSYNAPDGQKREGPSSGGSATATPASG